MAEENQSPFNDDQINGIKQIVSTIVNSAIATRDKMADKKREQDREALKTDFAKLLEEKLGAIGNKGNNNPDDPPNPDGSGKGGKNRGQDDATLRELATMRRQMEQLSKTSEENALRASNERAKNRENALRTAVSEVFDGVGISGLRFKGAYGVVRGQLKYVDDESDEIIFTDETGTELDYRAGLSSWLKSDEAKIYLPPTNTQGSGSRPRNGNPPIKGGPVTPGERSQRINAALSDWAERGGT